MANTLTDVIPELQTAAFNVGKKLVGFIPACYKNNEASRAAFNQSVEYPIVPALTASSVTPSNVSATGSDMTITNGSMVMDNLRKTSWHFTGEQLRAMNGGDTPQRSEILRQIFERAMRVLTDEIEASLWSAAYKSSSRGTGTAGTTPFGTSGDLSDFALVRQILDDNGAGSDGLKIVVNTAAMANLRGKQTVLYKVNESGSSQTLRQGVVGDIFGMDIHTSAQIGVHTKGTGTSYQLSAAGAVGDTSIAVDTGSGTLLAGDVVTVAGTSHKYIANSALAGGSFTIGRPGLLVAEADNDAITIGNSYTPSVAFQESALHLICREPDTGDDSASDTVSVQDPHSGLVFQLARYGQYMQSSWEMRVLYGCKAVNSDFIATLIG